MKLITQIFKFIIDYVITRSFFIVAAILIMQILNPLFGWFVGAAFLMDIYSAQKKWFKPFFEVQWSQPSIREHVKKFWWSYIIVLPLLGVSTYTTCLLYTSPSPRD